MASWIIHDSGEFLKEISMLDKAEEIIPKMLTESAQILTNEVKKVLVKHKQTGDMINSVKPSKVKRGKNGGYYLIISPTGSSKKRLAKSGAMRSRKDSERNMEKLAILEFGSSKQEATPVIGDAVKAAYEDVSRKLEEVYLREVGIK